MTEEYDPYQDMEVRDEYISEDTFAELIDKMPQVCVEIIVESEEGILIAKRNGDPPIWFWPGSRCSKERGYQKLRIGLLAKSLALRLKLKTSMARMNISGRTAQLQVHQAAIL